MCFNNILLALLGVVNAWFYYDYYCYSPVNDEFNLLSVVVINWKSAWDIIIIIISKQNPSHKNKLVLLACY